METNFGRVRSQCTKVLKGKGCRDTGLFKGGMPACSLHMSIEISATYLEVCMRGILVLEYKGQDEVKQDDHLISLLNKAYVYD